MVAERALGGQRLALACGFAGIAVFALGVVALRGELVVLAIVLGLSAYVSSLAWGASAS